MLRERGWMLRERGWMLRDDAPAGPARPPALPCAGERRHRLARLCIKFPWGKERKSHDLPRKTCYGVRGCFFDKTGTTQDDLGAACVGAWMRCSISR